MASQDAGDRQRAFAAIGLNPNIAPAPEVAETILPFADIGAHGPLEPGIVAEAVQRHLQLSAHMAEELSRSHPQDLSAPLRAYADTLHSLTILSQAFPNISEDAKRTAQSLANNLVRASEEAGTPFAPFPYWRGQDGRLGELSEAAARALEHCGGLNAARRNGWFVIDSRPDEYLFDTGRVGEALAAMPRGWRMEAHDNWLSEASRWLAEQTISPNFNYNAFAADLLPSERPDDAARYIHEGVLFGMITDGPDHGRWIDPHNQRLVYRMIMIRTLARAEGLEDAKINTALTVALNALETDMLALGGLTHPEDLSALYAAIDSRATPLAVNPQIRDALMHYGDYAIRHGHAKATSSAARHLSYYAATPPE